MFATTINFFDRSIIGVMVLTLEKMFGRTNTDYANIMILFKVAFSIGMLSTGGIVRLIMPKITPLEENLKLVKE